MTLAITLAMVEDFDGGMDGAGLAAKPQHRLEWALDEMLRGMSETERLRFAVDVLQYGIVEADRG